MLESSGISVKPDSVVLNTETVQRGDTHFAWSSLQSQGKNNENPLNSMEQSVDSNVVSESSLHFGKETPLSAMLRDPAPRGTSSESAKLRGDNQYSQTFRDVNFTNLNGRLPLKKIPVGTPIFNVELIPGKGGKLARSGGSSCVLLKHYSQPLYQKDTLGVSRRDPLGGSKGDKQTDSLSFMHLNSGNSNSVEANKEHLVKTGYSDLRSEHEDKPQTQKRPLYKMLEEYSLIRLPSNDLKILSSYCLASLGIPSNSLNNKKILGKAGASR